ncbi:hypothetical protein N0V82_010480 [Gnomoniopsis sp. IMI 355080]|nr:hypothetical protein N0V82_010480 [Gnomoniopsis sp. IMI 355080]
MTDIRRKQAQLHIKFSNLRSGINAEGSDRQIAALLDPTRPQPWRQRPPRYARPRHYGFVYPPHGATVAEAAELHDERILYSALSQRITLDSATKRQGRKTVNQATRHLSKLGFRYYRTLGWGGEGLATLFYVKDATGRWRRVVAKMALSPSKNFNNERIMSLRQLGVDLAQGDMQNAMDSALRGAESRMIMFEFAEFGSLSSLLKKFSEPVTTANDPRKRLAPSHSISSK